MLVRFLLLNCLTYDCNFAGHHIDSFVRSLRLRVINGINFVSLYDHRSREKSQTSFLFCFQTMYRNRWWNRFPEIDIRRYLWEYIPFNRILSRTIFISSRILSQYVNWLYTRALCLHYLSLSRNELSFLIIDNPCLILSYIQVLFLS